MSDESFESLLKKASEHIDNFVMAPVIENDLTTKMIRYYQAWMNGEMVKEVLPFLEAGHLLEEIVLVRHDTKPNLWYFKLKDEPIDMSRMIEHQSFEEFMKKAMSMRED